MGYVDRYAARTAALKTLFWFLIVTTCKFLRLVRLTLLSWPTSSCFRYILLTQITYAVSFHMVHIVKISVFNYSSGYISGAGEMISTCIYMYEHIEKISKIFPGKSKISQKNVQMINSAWALGSSDFQRVLDWKTRQLKVIWMKSSHIWFVIHWICFWEMNSPFSFEAKLKADCCVIPWLFLFLLCLTLR